MNAAMNYSLFTNGATAGQSRAAQTTPSYSTAKATPNRQ
jgi:hypothetical protein